MTRPVIRVELVGLKELNAALRELPQALEKKVLDGALKAGGRLIEKEAERRVPVLQKPDPRRKPGTLRRALATIARRDTQGHSALVVVKPRRLSARAVSAFKRRTGLKAADNPSDPFYWWFIEYGTRKMAARPFLRPAFEARKREALARVHERLLGALTARWAKLGWQRRFRGR